jgi:hypothetical protein
MTNIPTADADGFSPLNSQQVRENVVEDLRGSSEFGENAQTDSDKALGQLVDPPADGIGQVYELQSTLVYMLDPDTAVGVHLDQIARFRGLTREPASPSKVTMTYAGINGTVIPTGTQIRVPDGPIFATDIEAEIAVGFAYPPATAITTGPQEALAGTINEQVDIIPNISSVTNAADAELGQDVETDVELRLRIAQSAGATGNGTVPSISAAVTALDFVTTALAVENDTNVTDSRGISPHHTKVVVYPETAVTEQLEQIAAILWAQKGTGMGYDGDVVYTISDSQNKPQAIRWSWATDVLIYWDITVTPGADYPSNGDDLVAAAVLAYGNDLDVADDVLPVGAIDRIVSDVPGVDNLAVLVKAGGAPGAGDNGPVYIDWDQRSDHDSGRIVVTSP